MKKVIRCSECGYCRGTTRRGNTRYSYICMHPDEEYIKKYFKAHRINKMEGFLGYGKAHSEEVPIKTSPAWCPKKKV